MNFIKSPFNYTGGKYRLLSQLMPLFPETNTFVDLFCGGGTVGVNVNAKNIYMNDKDQYVFGLLSYLQENSSAVIIERLEKLIEDFGLTQSYKNGIQFYKNGVKDNLGLSRFNKAGFMRLRDAFNQEVHSGKVNYNLLLCLMIYAFNYQMRFNRKGEFNTPVGKGDFNPALHTNIKLFCEALKNKNIVLSNYDFDDFNLPEDPNTFVYCDIPYIITDLKVYHTAWDIEDEKRFYSFLDNLKCKWAVSNVFTTNGKTNNLLIEWAQKYNVYHLNFDYATCSYHRKNHSTITDEVLIRNF